MEKDDQIGKTPQSASLEKKPWPMWPFVLSVVIFIVGYTWVQFEFRKTGPTNQPYQDLLSRQKAVVEKNMYDWYSLKAEHAAEDKTLSSKGIQIRAADGPLENFLPQQLVYYIASRPILVERIENVGKEDEISRGAPYHLRLSLPDGMGDDRRFKLSAFYKEGELHLLAQLLVKERKDADDLINENLVPASFSIPTEPIESESVAVKLYTKGKIREWTVPVNP